MTRDEKAARDAANISDGKETVLQDGKTFPALNITIGAGRAQDLIVDYIPLGAENAITGEELARMTGWSYRAVTDAVRRARLHGAPICSSTGEVPGYYMTEKPGEIDAMVRGLDRRTREVMKTRDALAMTRDRLSGQERMEGF